MPIKVFRMGGVQLSVKRIKARDETEKCQKALTGFKGEVYQTRRTTLRWIRMVWGVFGDG